MFSLYFFPVPEKAIIAKSSVLLDVKPWDDETDMAVLEKEVRTIVMDGLVWGACKCICAANTGYTLSIAISHTDVTVGSSY